MTTTAVASRPRLAEADLARLLEEMKGADTVELKLTVPAPAHRSTIRSLPIDAVEAQPRQVFFFDTPELTLDSAGVVVRARRRQGGRADTVVKLRPVSPAELPKELRRSAAFNVEIDVVPGGFVTSGSMKGRTTNVDVRDAVDGRVALRTIFTKEQRRLFAARAPQGVDFDALVPLGPTFLLKAIFDAREIRREFVAEMWLYPDGSRVLELSTKCLPEQAFLVAAESRAYLASQGVELSGNQQTKTRTALEFFRRELAASAVPGATSRRSEEAGRGPNGSGRRGGRANEHPNGSKDGADDTGRPPEGSEAPSSS
jgi:hypothetical protein